MKKSCTKPFAAITGASSGIGKVYAEELAKKGYDLALCARRIENLSKIKSDLEKRYSINVYIQKTDLDKREERQSFFKNSLGNKAKELKSSGQILKFNELVFINNAGFGTVAPFSEVSIDRELEMVNLNCSALLELSFLVYKEMKELGFGSIVNLGSIASFPPMAYMSTYGATKAFVHSFSMALHAEARKSGIHVLSHLPGPTESEFHIAAGLKKKINRINSMKTDTVVKEALKALDNKNAVCINGFKNKLLAGFAKLCPMPLAGRIVENILIKEIKN